MAAMAWITQPDRPDLPNVLRVQASDPDLLRTHLRFYRHLMFGPGELDRVERELAAVVTSAVNACFY